MSIQGHKKYSIRWWSWVWQYELWDHHDIVLILCKDSVQWMRLNIDHLAVSERISLISTMLKYFTKLFLHSHSSRVIGQVTMDNASHNDLPAVVSIFYLGNMSRSINLFTQNSSSSFIMTASLTGVKQWPESSLSSVVWPTAGPLSLSNLMPGDSVSSFNAHYGIMWWWSCSPQ